MISFPVQRDTVDMDTGKVTARDTVQFHILPPPAGVCQDCGVKHDPAQPHNAASLHYQYSFYAKNDGRWPTWVDAMAHCTDEVREEWTYQLTKMGGRRRRQTAPRRCSMSSPEQTQQTVAGHMDEILVCFRAGGKITVLVRFPGQPTHDFMMTDDDPHEAIAMIQRRQAEAGAP